jgi:hypothetical protein
MTLARQERRKKNKELRQNLLESGRAARRDTPIIMKNIDKDSIVFDGDGYKHKTCPIAEINDPELMGIMTDTLYCLDVGLPPNDGNAYDQSYLFRIAFTTLSRERDAVKAEREKKYIDNSKKKHPQGTSKGKKR